MQKKYKIAVVIVTYNRIEKLKKALMTYEKQTILPEYVIVVNNASTDNTKNYLMRWKEEKNLLNKIVINAESNLGGSGGFYLGEQEALKLDVDWILVSDDDAYLSNNYIEESMKILEHEKENVSIVCGLVEQNGDFNNLQRAVVNNIWTTAFEKPIDLSSFNKYGYSEIDFVSYVGPIINKEILNKAGLIDKNFFIWWDDTDHSIRLKKYGKILCSKKALIYHDVTRTREAFNWKTYYGYRNRIYTLKKYYPLQCSWIAFLLIIKTILSPIKGRTLKEFVARFRGIKDGILGNMGQHKIYRAGWKP